MKHPCVVDAITVTILYEANVFFTSACSSYLPRLPVTGGWHRHDQSFAEVGLFYAAYDVFEKQKHFCSRYIRFEIMTGHHDWSCLGCNSSHRKQTEVRKTQTAQTFVLFSLKFLLTDIFPKSLWCLKMLFTLIHLYLNYTQLDMSSNEHTWSISDRAAGVEWRNEITKICL